ncbi:MAG: hypothetical protein JJT94_13320 [Bernardetiaceae bacterium]|nr:hypothetical protein [Bernardetiaceae bacterium]
MKTWLIRTFSWRKVKLLVLLVIIINVVFAWLTPQIVGGGVARIPDISFGYHADQLYQWFEAMGSSGRELYFYMTLSLDMLYPLVYTLLFCFVLIGVEAKSWIYLPLTASLSDISENISMLFLLNGYPERYEGIVRWASASTQTKWILISFLVVVLLWRGIIFWRKS